MGYRSEVGLALIEEDYNELLELAKPLLEEFGNNCILSDKPADRFEIRSEKYVYLHWDALKWYDTFPEVQLIEKFMNDHRHSFIRIGEDYDDIEYHVKSDEVNDAFYEIQYPYRSIMRYEDKREQTNNADTKWLYANMLLYGATPEEFKILYDLDRKYSLGDPLYPSCKDFPIKE